MKWWLTLPIALLAAGCVARSEFVDKLANIQAEIAAYNVKKNPTDTEAHRIAAKAAALAKESSGIKIPEGAQELGFGLLEAALPGAAGLIFAVKKMMDAKKASKEGEELRTLVKEVAPLSKEEANEKVVQAGVKV